MSILTEIQHELKAPKGQYNSFGKYKYRSCEDIVEAVKPILHEVGAHLIISDEIIEVGGRIYVKATATVSWDGGEASAIGLAREPESKKGMDESQITGAASSYARKYALNGLFAIDDTKDADATNQHNEPDESLVEKRIKGAKDMDELISVWKSLTPAQHKKFVGVKDTRKAQLEAA